MRFTCTSLKYGSIFLLFLLISQAFNTAFAQTDRKITGNLVDKDNIPIIGASVSVKGTNKATVTTDNGAFSITAKTGDKLVFTFMGYEPKELTIGAGSNYKVTISEANTSLTDVVVVGYGKGSRKGLSSAITSVKPEELNKGAIADVGQLLQGKVPGLNISSSGDPNKPAAVILRGASTINSPGAPFYVIDGIPGADIAAIAPADIASIDVLKDAAATAIYGNRAASGVIIVTTKRGKSGKPQLS
ncbi:TonB-dependent receptor plug domain-containing protein [Pedobacter sp. GSP4]|uniref:TonB-dependent receptor plug domain-containing protein n=1 Tax=Pedobacter sp. GSP4 TaxID=3453716 RepID=UPI003EEB4E99